MDAIALSLLAIMMKVKIKVAFHFKISRLATLQL